MKSSIQLNKTSNFICQSGWFVTSNPNTNIIINIIHCFDQNFSNAIKKLFVII